MEKYKPNEIYDFKLFFDLLKFTFKGILLKIMYFKNTKVSFQTQELFTNQKFFLFMFFFFAFGIACKLKSNEILTKEVKEKIYKQATEIVSKMSTEEKAGQVIHIAIPSKTVDEKTIAEIKKIKPGGIILFGMNLGTTQEIQTLTYDLQKLAKENQILPFFISTDQEGGRVIRIENGITSFPGAMAIGQTANTSFAEKVGFITSYQANQLGVNVIFAPVLDINNNPKNPVINTRSFGSYLEQVLQMGVAYEQGARLGGSLPVIKHFPGHGDTNIDSHLGLPIIHKTIEEITNFELIPFQKAIENGAKAVMSAHIVYPKIDSKYPATLSPNILRGILRERLGFSGIVFTDAMEMHAISKNFQDEKRGSLAILAGADIVLLTSYGKTSQEYYEMILESINNEEFQRGERNLLDEALIRQIALKIEQGLFFHPESYFEINDESIKNYFKEWERIRNEEYSKLKQEGISKLNEEISIQSIRSYKKDFEPLKLENLSEYEFIIQNKRLQNAFRKLGVSSISAKKFWKKSKSSQKKIIVFDLKDSEELKKLTKKLKKYKNQKIIFLNYGNPFLDYPKWENLEIVFTFSPTKSSFEALVKRLFGNTPIQKAQLIFESSKEITNSQ